VRERLIKDRQKVLFSGCIFSPQEFGLASDFCQIHELLHGQEVIMSLIKWTPFSEIDTLHKEMNRLFDQFVPARREQLFGDDFVPAAELKETDAGIELKLEVPGLNPEDIDIQVTADAVSIAGERKSESTTDKDGVTRSEFYYGRFQRIVPLPARVQNTGVEAQYKDGILTLNLPKDEQEQQKVVKVSVT
jgi:HSP20 family protein